MSYEVFENFRFDLYTIRGYSAKLHDGVSQSQAKVLGMSCLTFLVKLLSRFLCFYSQEMQACLQNNKLSLKSYSASFRDFSKIHALVSFILWK